jgi:hypothetical protein
MEMIALILFGPESSTHDLCGSLCACNLSFLVYWRRRKSHGLFLLGLALSPNHVEHTISHDMMDGTVLWRPRHFRILFVGPPGGLKTATPKCSYLSAASGKQTLDPDSLQVFTRQLDGCLRNISKLVCILDYPVSVFVPPAELCIWLYIFMEFDGAVTKKMMIATDWDVVSEPPVTYDIKILLLFCRDRKRKIHMCPISGYPNFE